MKMALEQWLEKNNLPKVVGAERFVLGQALTDEEASCVRRLLNRAYLDSEGLSVLADFVEFEFPFNLPFVGLFLNLIKDGCVDQCADPWKDPLCYTLTSDDWLVIKGLLAQAK